MLFYFILTFVCFLIDNVSCAPYLWSSHIGGQGGSVFNLNKFYAGLAIKKLEVWQGDWQLRGIRITYTDGSQQQVGGLKEDYTSFELDYINGERITYLSLYGNGAGTRCGAFHIKTNLGRDFFPKMTSWGLKTEYVTSHGGGIILGIYGKGGSDIDSLSFMMIRPIQSMTLRNVNYDMSALATPSRKTVYEIDLVNPSSTDSDKGFIQKSMSESRSGKWSISSTFTFGQEYKVSAGIPEVADVSVSTSWSLSVTGSYESSWTESVSDTVQIALICPANTKTKIWYYYYVGTASITMTGTMYVLVDNGESWTYSVTGTYDGVDDTRIVGDSILLANYVDGKWVDAADDDVPIINLKPLKLFNHFYKTNQYDYKAPELNINKPPNDNNNYPPSNYINYYIKIAVGTVTLIVILLIITAITSIYICYNGKKNTKYKHLDDDDDDDQQI